MKFIIASNNKKKIAEIARILEPLGIEAVTAQQAGFELGEIEETGATFAQNALIKAKTVFEKTKIPAIADDSGLEVYAINNRPGVYTARYGGEGLTDVQRYMHLLSELTEVSDSDRGAAFVSHICCYIDKDNIIDAEGRCEGKITFEPFGNGGFGYDPIFFCPEFGKTFSELTPEQKDCVSHRGRALRELKDKLEGFLKKS